LTWLDLKWAQTGRGQLVAGGLVWGTSAARQAVRLVEAGFQRAPLWHGMYTSLACLYFLLLELHPAQDSRRVRCLSGSCQTLDMHVRQLSGNCQDFWFRKSLILTFSNSN